MSQAACASGKKVNVPSGSSKKGPVPAVMFGQPAKGVHGLVVLQEWWGLNDQIQEVADHLAKQGGFVTIVPDLYRGKVAIDKEEAGHLMGGLDWPGAVQDIRDCVAYLKGKDVGCAKVGVTGFCMGGALTLAAAALVSEVDAAASFYGIPGDDLADVKKIKIPLQCHFGDKDEVEGFSDPKSQEKLKEKLDTGKVNYKFFSYPGAGHAFINKTNQTNFKEEYFKTSFERLVTFFKDM